MACNAEFCVCSVVALDVELVGRVAVQLDHGLRVIRFARVEQHRTYSIFCVYNLNLTLQNKYSQIGNVGWPVDLRRQSV